MRIPTVKRGLLPLIVSAAVIASAVLIAGAAEQTEAGDGVRRLRVAFPQQPGMNEILPDGSRSGYNYDYLRGLSLYQKWRCEYVGFDEDYTNALDMLRQNRADVALCMPKSYALNSKEFVFSENPAGVFKSMLLVQKGQTNYTYTAGPDWNGIRIAVPQKLRVTKQNLEEFAQEKNFTYIEVPCENSIDARAALHDGRADAAAVNTLRRLSGEKILAAFGTGELYAVVRSGDKDLIDEINEANRRLHAETPQIYNTLTRKYFLLDDSNRIVFQPEENHFIQDYNKSHRPLRAIIAPARPPLSEYDPATGEMTGVLVDICRLVLERSGLNYELIPCKTRDEYWEIIRCGDIDLKLDNWDNDSYAEDLNMQLTNPYFTSSLSLVRRLGSTDTVKTAAVLRNGDMNVRQVLSTIDVSIKEFSSYENAAASVAEGEVDSFYIYSITADYLVHLDVARRLSSVTVPGYSASFAIAIPDTIDPRITQLLNKVIASVSLDEYDTILARYKLPPRPISLRLLVTLNPVETFLIVAFLFAVVIGVAVYIIRRKSQYSATLKDMLERAQEAERTKSAFLSLMSHEIRTPLNSVIGYSDLLERFDDIHDEDRRYYLKSIRVSAKFLLALINDILDISKIESNRFTLLPSPCDVRTILRELANVFEQRISAKSLEFEIDVPEKFPRLNLDAIRLRQILFNLVGNAVKFTERGQITARVSFTQEDERHGTLRIAVEDTGIGVPENMREKIFQRFVQIESMRRERTSTGTGLGLAISRSIARLMGGDLTVGSRARGQGSVFTLELNHVVKVSEPAVEQPVETGDSADEKGETLPPNFGKKVLLVDDIPFNLSMLSAMVRRVGIEPLTARNGHDALKVLQSVPPESVLMVLTDLWMPNMNGDELAQCIRRQPGYENLPIAVVTADVELKSQSTVTNFNDILYKPITFAAVSKIICKNASTPPPPPPCYKQKGLA